jgi:type II secretory pathway pseudopilin PulG
MTLLELVVALAVGGTALAAGGIAFTTLVDRRASMIAEGDSAQRALSARRALAAWIGGVRLGTAPEVPITGTRGDLRTAAGEAPNDELTVITMAEATPRRIRLYVDHALPRPALVADITASGDATSRVLVSADVAGLEARYLTSAFGRPEWRRTWSGALLPAAVALRLRAAEGTTLPLALQLPITIPLANSP